MDTYDRDVAPDLTEQIGKLMSRASEIGDMLKDEQADVGALKAELNDEIKPRLAALDAEREAKEREAEREQMAKDLADLQRQVRTPSKAHAILGAPRSDDGGDYSIFFSIVAAAKSRDFDVQKAAKARLAEMGVVYAYPDPAAKATVGDTDAAGGFLVPNPVVSDIVLQAQPGRDVVDLFNNINGVSGSAVDIPWESAGATRATIVAPGVTKDNVNFVVNNYTATLYTLARIFDVGNQLLRHSAGAAEQLVRSKLARAFALGEDYYALQGAGSTEPHGLLTAIGTTGTYVTSHTPSATTLAGSAAAAIAKAAGALEDRGAIADGVVMNTANWWVMAAQGTDEAGFFFAPAQGPGGIDATRGSMSIWGLSTRKTPNMPSDSLVVGEYKSADFFRGQGYRVDVSDQAGDRWDKNLTGFRGEEEIAFDARPAVYTGHFQRITDVLA